jgi:DNA-binding winged helix-turn-helix (wHTH) protein
METPSKTIYIFGDFSYEKTSNSLYFRSELIHVERKSLEVLKVLVNTPKKVVPTSEIIDQVWKDNPIGITSAHLAQNISKLRKAFARFEPDVEYIKNVKGSGYIFCSDIEVISPQAFSSDNDVTRENGFPSLESPSAEREQSLHRSKYLTVAAALILVILASALTWWRFGDDEREIREVVQDSQIFESLVLYKSPGVFKEEDLDKYWTREFDENSNFDRRRIREAVKGLIDKGERYGDETKCEQFEFQSIEISTNDQAVVKTFEKWFISVYSSDGTLLRNKYVGPYFVSYVLRKIEGRWLIEKSTTARVTRPKPRLDSTQLVSSPIAGRQFFVNIVGADFEPETINIEVTGPGCPETKPCNVPNSALRENSSLSSEFIKNVPLTLASGEFKIAIRNGNSLPSNHIALSVP